MDEEEKKNSEVALLPYPLNANISIAGTIALLR
jgi:hypothetical protein